MLSIVRAEYLKTRKSMGRVLIWGFPIITFDLAFVLTLEMTNAYAESVWNWWYTLLLPGMLAIICYLSIMREKKTRYYHLMTLSISKRKLVMGKIIYMGCVILVSDMIIFVGATFGGFLLTTCVPFGGALAAVLVLTITQLWEIPLLLFLSERFGMIVELLVCLVLTVGGVIIAPTGKFIHPDEDSLPTPSYITKWNQSRRRQSAFGCGSRFPGDLHIHYLVHCCNFFVLKLV